MTDAPATPDTMGLREFAAHIGKKPSYVTQLKEQGRLILTRDGRVQVAASKQLIADSMDPAKAGVVARHAAARAAGKPAAVSPAPAAGAADSGADAGDQADNAVPLDSPFARRRAEAQARREEALARKAEREEQLELGELLERGPTVAAIGKHLASLCSALRNLPIAMAPALGAADETRCRALLAEEIEHALADVERKLKTIGRPA